MIGLQIDMETANNITRLTLTDYRDYLQSENEKWEANPRDDDNPEGYWLHPEDYARNFKTVNRINKILEDFGGELYGEREAGELDSSPSMVEAFKGLEAYFLEIRKSASKESD
jgi:hypothetical protein